MHNDRSKTRPVKGRGILNEKKDEFITAPSNDLSRRYIRTTDVPENVRGRQLRETASGKADPHPIIVHTKLEYNAMADGVKYISVSIIRNPISLFLAAPS